jgi:hypothetical protein
MSAAVWNEPQVPEHARADERRAPGGGRPADRRAVSLTTVPAPRRPAGDGRPHAGGTSSAEKA